MTQLGRPNQLPGSIEGNLCLAHYVDAETVAGFLSVKKGTVYRWAREGLMGGAYRFNGLWRFNLDEVIAWAAACRQQLVPPR